MDLMKSHCLGFAAFNLASRLVHWPREPFLKQFVFTCGQGAEKFNFCVLLHTLTRSSLKYFFVTNNGCI